VTNPETVLSQYYDAGRSPFYILKPNFAAIDNRAYPIRLSTPGWVDISLNNLRGIATTELLFELSKEKIVTRIQPFAKRVRLFVERYFEFMKNHIDANLQQFPDDPFLMPLDWIFSTWLPLPHAKVILEPRGSDGSVEFVEFDIVFWTGSELLGIQVEQKGTLLKSQRALLERFKLEQPQFKVISIDHDQLPEDKQIFPSEIFGENFLDFWADVDLPKGPPLQQMLAQELIT
jgi:hypothetical protein